MKCMACGAEMQLVQTVPDETMMVAGFEHRTLQCSGCDEIERRLVFNPERAAAAAADAASIAEAPPVAPGVAPSDASAPEHTADAPTAPDAPVAEAAADDMPIDETPIDETTVGETTVRETISSETTISEAPVDGAASVGADAPTVTRERRAPQSAWQRAMARLRGRPTG